jgi:Ca2+-transporting ATPase
MRVPPRDPDESVLTRQHWFEIAGWAALIGGCVLTALLLAERRLGLTTTQAVTVSFLTLAFGKVWFTFTLRSPGSGLLRNEVTRNPWVWGAVGVCIALLIATVYLPGLSDLLRTAEPGADGWMLLLGMSAIPLVVAQVVREVQRRRSRRED